ncbi:hypothetical protein PT974_05699 [Cladobotryum mycophilum]|uniref:Phosphoglycerate mutase family protein n=1 Tax=Cladobotryum mycophilum TaxID=491253 RepID=A0ABR0SJJ4_9HYPO
MKAFAILLLAALATASPAPAAKSKPTVYLIRHGEKPADPKANGLSDQGKKRAQCLRTVFGAKSQYNIGYLMAETPSANGEHTRPRDTILPLAGDLGLNIDVSCGGKDPECVKKAVHKFEGPGNILICWKHTQLNNIAEALGAKKVDQWSDSVYDLIWTDPSPYSKIVDITSEECPGLDV